MERMSQNNFGKTYRGLSFHAPNGDIAGGIGVIHHNPLWAFAVITDVGRKYPRDVMQIIRQFGDWAGQYYNRLYAEADPEEHNAARCLKTAGFEEYDIAPDGKMRFVWDKQRLSP